MAKKRSAEERELDREIENIFADACNGVQIPLMDIPKVFAVGKRAKLEGRDVRQAIVELIATIKKS